MFIPKQIVIDASNSSYKREKWINELANTTTEFWNVVEEGAFKMSI